MSIKTHHVSTLSYVHPHEDCLRRVKTITLNYKYRVLTFCFLFLLFFMHIDNLEVKKMLHRDKMQLNTDLVLSTNF